MTPNQVLDPHQDSFGSVPGSLEEALTTSLTTSLINTVDTVDLDDPDLRPEPYWLDSPIGASQEELEKLYASNQLIPTMREDFRQDFGDALMALEQEGEYQSVPCPMKFLLDLMVQAALHKRAPLEAMVSILAHHFKRLDGIKNPYQACVDAIELAANHDLVDINERTRSWDESLITEVVVIYEVRPETQRRLDLFQYPLPMIEKPQEVRTNKDTGYRTIRGSLILKKNHIEEDICLDHINRLNSQALAVNQDAVQFMQNSWKNLDKRKLGEDREEFLARQKAFRKYDRTSRDVLAAMLVHQSKGEDGIYLTHKYDKRGRTYAQGYHFQYQSNDWCKACVTFFHKEKLKEDSDQ